MSFVEVRFPSDISSGATGGPMRVTDVVSLRSGFEEVNSIWKHSRRKWDAAYGIKRANDLHAVLEFWEAMGGRHHQFRWKDHADFKSCPPETETSSNDQIIGVGDGAEVSFQLIKTYGVGSVSYERPIKKPVNFSVKISLDGVEQVSGWAVDTTNGVILFSSPPGNGVVVGAGFEFDVPVRFDVDFLSTQFEAYRGGSTSLEIIEVRV